VAPNSGPNANPLDLFPQVCISFICTFKASLGGVQLMNMILMELGPSQYGF
jgi:hypothetical protein